MNDAFYDYENRVERGQTVTIAGRDARWTKIKDLKVGARIAIPKDKTLDRFTNTRHSGLSRIDSGVAAPQNDGCNSVSWDEIVSIKSVGREHVYDIEVEGTHNFIGNGIFAHNTYVSGNVGVGSSSPVNKFEVSGAAVVGSGYAQIAAAPADGLLVQGNVGIGTTNPGATLEINGTLKVDSLTTGGSALYINGGILSSSDQSLKNNITGFGSVLDKINALVPVDYNWKKSGMSDTGFIAQDVAAVFPELVGDMGNGTLGIYYSKFTPYLVKGMQELDANLKFEIFNLKSIFNDQIANVGNVGIGSTSPLSVILSETKDLVRQQANAYDSSSASWRIGMTAINAKISENGQIQGQQGAAITTLSDQLAALQKQVAALQAVILSGANGSLANASNGGTVPEKETPSSGSEGVSFNSGLQSVLVTASGTIPSDLSYGMGASEASASAGQVIGELGNQVISESTASAVLGEATQSAVIGELGNQVISESSPSSYPITQLPDYPTTQATSSAEASASAVIGELGNQVISESSPSSYPITQATPSATQLPDYPITQSGDVALTTFGNLTVTAGLRVFGQTLLGPTNIAGITTVGNIVIDEDSLDAFGILRIQTLARGLIELMAGQITIDTSGNIILHSGNLVVETGQIYGNDSMRGSTTLTTGVTYAVVPQSWSKAPKSIVVTPDYNTRAWVENLGNNGFIIRVDTAPDRAQKVYWIAVW